MKISTALTFACSLALATQDVQSAAAQAPATPSENTTTNSEKNEQQSLGYYEYEEAPGYRNFSCDVSYFPNDAFYEQSDVSRVYLYPARLPESSVFYRAGLTRYASVFGLRVVVDDSVDDHQLLHLASTYAHILDSNRDGVPDNLELVHVMRNNRATLFVLRDIPRIRNLMIETTTTSFPVEFQQCPYYFDFEESSRIVPGGLIGDGSCSENSNARLHDRSVAFIVDHIFGRGYSQIFSRETHEIVKERMRQSARAGLFAPENTGCPPENEDCATMMYMSWAMSTYHGFDECWCKSANILRFCNREMLLHHEPEVGRIISGLFPYIENFRPSRYQPTLAGVVVEQP